MRRRLQQVSKYFSGKWIEMSTKTICILLTTLLVSTILDAQLVLTNRAARLCQEKDYAGAREAITLALESEDEKNHPYAWYVSGFIHKEIYKALETGMRSSTARATAVRDMEKSLNLDTGGEYRKMTCEALRYLATTYLNDALLMTRDMTPGAEQEPELVYSEFERIMAIADPRADLLPYRLEMLRKLAQAHYLLWEKNVTKRNHYDLAVGYYQQVLKVEPADCESNCNLAILYYNNGVHKIRMISSTTDMMDLILIQNECIELFRLALPLAETTFNSCPPRLDYYKAMMFIHRALGNEDLYDEYKSHSEELIRSGKLKY